jgi:uncharacterized membrane protein (GlpM family)
MSTFAIDSMFLLSLLLKIAMTAGIVVAASILVERSGPFIGALIASLPTAGGAAYIILALEHPPEFIAAGTIGSIVSMAVTAVFALAYAHLAQRQSLVVSLTGAYLVWFGGVMLSRFVDWTIASALAVTAVIYAMTIVAGAQFRIEAKVRPKPERYDVVWRTAVVSLCVIVVTLASHSIGSFASGVFAFFPVAMGSFFLILHSRVSGPEAASVAAHVQAPLIGLIFGFVAIYYLAVPLGVWWSYLIALALGLFWNAILWVGRRQLRRRQVV